MYNLNVTMNYDNDDKYREQLLELYELDTYNEIVMLKKNEAFLDKFSKNKELQNLLEDISEKHILKKDKYLGLIILLAYDYLKLFYPIVIQLYNAEVLNNKDIDKLKNLLH